MSHRAEDVDLVPRGNLEAWLKHLRHSFPCMPFKSSTQAQRQNLSQNAVPLHQPTNVPGQTQTYQELPTTSSSLGAPALLHLLKQYALSTPHSSLTVGVVGYPNVGKSSLINSLKRSRACAVAAMPGKTRVTQEVVLDKGVKIVDCPGVVLEDIGKDMTGEAGRKRAAEIMLRNCVKAELVDDPVSPGKMSLLRTYLRSDLQLRLSFLKLTLPSSKSSTAFRLMSMSANSSSESLLFEAVLEKVVYPTLKARQYLFFVIGTVGRFHSTPFHLFTTRLLRLQHHL